MAALQAVRDGVVELVDAVDAVGLGVVAAQCAGVRPRRTSIGAVEIAAGVGWAAAFDGVDDVPILGVLDFGWVGLVGDGHLAGAAAVDSRVGASTEVEG